MMELQPILEVIRIKQEVRTLDFPLAERKLNSPEVAGAIAKKFIGDEDREVFLVFCLNIKNQITAIHRCNVGILDAALVREREIFKACILNQAAGLIIAHNHPSAAGGKHENLIESPPDIEVTKRIAKAGQLMGIPLIDHLIVSTDAVRSLREAGHIF